MGKAKRLRKERANRERQKRAEKFEFNMRINETARMCNVDREQILRALKIIKIWRENNQDLFNRLKANCDKLVEDMRRRYE